jgi:hypothetical protein
LIDLVPVAGPLGRLGGAGPGAEGRNLDHVALARILESEVNLGCRNLLEREPELVHAHETANARFVTDLDTVEDVEALARRTGWRIELPALAPAP